VFHALARTEASDQLVGSCGTHPRCGGVAAAKGLAGRGCPASCRRPTTPPPAPHRHTAVDMPLLGLPPEQGVALEVPAAALATQPTDLRHPAALLFGWSGQRWRRANQRDSGQSILVRENQISFNITDLHRTHCDLVQLLRSAHIHVGAK
jgi:hypothetical protein